ncbi:MAG: type II toxin-antitoxin system VapC family toxin [Myxococcales bacterium]|nr:type II toxin-antitoxin system VapC family toxin [Myxococcales bacterium]
MNILLDTCTVLWIATEPSRLPARALVLYADPTNQVWFSAVSAWEISVKNRRGKLPLPNGLQPSAFISEVRRRHGWKSLAVNEADIAFLERLPEVHQDPFDRMLICQALANQMTILTPDPLITAYAVATAWA